MVAEKGRKPASSKRQEPGNATQDFLKVIRSSTPEVTWKEGTPQVVTTDNISKFMKGEITWAQVQGVSMEQAYALAEMGFHLFVQGKYEDAQTIFEGLIVLNPYDGYFHSVLGSIFALTGNADKAIREYSIAANLEPADPHVFVNRAELLLKKGQFDEALKDLRHAIAIDPDGNNPAVSRARALAAATVGLIEQILKSKQQQPEPAKPHGLKSSAEKSKQKK